MALAVPVLTGLPVTSVHPEGNVTAWLGVWTTINIKPPALMLAGIPGAIEVVPAAHVPLLTNAIAMLCRSQGH